jgi:hypothetical protein
MVAYVTRTSHEPSYGRGVITSIATSGLLLALILGSAGELLGTIAACVALGNAVGVYVGFAAKLRARRRPPPDPWSPASTVSMEPYVMTGAGVGGLVGAALVILYLLGVVS